MPTTPTTPTTPAATGGNTTGDESGPPRRKGVVIGACVALAALLLGVLSQFAASGGGGRAPAAADPEAGASSGASSADGESGVHPELEELARRDDGDPLAQGHADAPVVMIEYADFKCPFCGKFARDTEPELVEEYVDAGVLRIEWRNLPIFGEDSERAARAAWAAGQQDRFWQFHETAYAEEDNKAEGFPRKRVESIARAAGVEDLERFRSDMNSPEAAKALKRDREEAYGLGATSTPVFLVNGRPIAGAQPKEVFTGAIEAAAEQARGGKGGTGESGSGESGAGESEGAAGR